MGLQSAEQGSFTDWSFYLLRPQQRSGGSARRSWPSTRPVGWPPRAIEGLRVGPFAAAGWPSTGVARAASAYLAESVFGGRRFRLAGPGAVGGPCDPINALGAVPRCSSRLVSPRSSPANRKKHAP